jgi:adenosylcobinamide kinase/adenosylcobinamide-phosphate guanylyltransferase
MKTLVIGGARSGKTAAAERLLAERDDVTYVATGYQPQDDAEWQERVERHRSRRPAGWKTVEALDLAVILHEPGNPLLVDCLTLWLTRLMDRHLCWDDDVWSETGAHRLHADVEALVRGIRTTTRDLVLVTNEVGQGVVPASASGRRFRDEMGLLNSAVAAACGEVLWCVAGRTMRL